MADIFETLHADLEKVVTDHQAEIKTALDTAARVADNPAAQAVLGLLHIPPGAATALGDFLQRLDAEFAAMTPAAAGVSPAPAAAGPDPTQAAGADSASPPLFQPLN